MPTLIDQLTRTFGESLLSIVAAVLILIVGWLLGALAVAFALAFGLGSREIAAREVESVLDRWRAGEGEVG